MNDIKILERPLSDKTVIEKNYLDVVVKDGVFPSGQFSLALPKLWSTEAYGSEVVPLPKTPVVKIARFTPGAKEALGYESDAQIQIWAANLPRVVNGSDWLRRWATTQDFDLKAIRELPTSNGLMGDAVALSKKTGRLHRFITIKDGNLLILIDGSSNTQGEPEKLSLQEISLMAAIRFRLLNPSGAVYAEPVEMQKLASRIGTATFQSPQSWEREEAGDTPPDGAALKLTTGVGSRLTGTLIAALSPNGSMVEEMENVLVKKLENQGYSFSEPKNILKGQGADLDFKVFQRRGTFKEKEVILLCLRASSVGQSVSLTVLSPQSSEEFEAWAINRRVFEIALETVTFRQT